MNIIQAIETDLTNAWSGIETDAEKFGAVIWADVKPLVLAVQPAVYADLKNVIVGILTAFEGKDLATVETGLLNVLEAGGTPLFGAAKGLGSNLLQLLISLAKAA
jgi:hypothetical protein